MRKRANKNIASLENFYRVKNAHNAACPKFIIKLYALEFISESLILAIRFYYNKYRSEIDKIY